MLITLKRSFRSFRAAEFRERELLVFDYSSLPQESGVSYVAIATIAHTAGFRAGLLPSCNTGVKGVFCKGLLGLCYASN